MAIMAVLALALGACETEEAMRVQGVIGAYDCAFTCTLSDLRGIEPDTTFSGQATKFVAEAEDWKNGQIFVDESEVTLNYDSTFTFSSTTYYLSGSFGPDGQISYVETIIDTESNTRTDCQYTGSKKP